MDLNQARTFVEVARAGSFAAAARRLGLPKSTVSARVQSLEARLGAQLLKRSTRIVSLTAEGSAYLEAVAGAVDTLVDAEAATSAGKGVLSGKIRFTAPLEFPRDAITGALAEFMRKHPRVSFDILLTNRPLDLIADNIDVALRGGDPGGAGLIVRKVGRVASALYASPAYIERRGAPRAIAELAGHDLLLFTPPTGSNALRQSELTAVVEPRICCDNFSFLRRMAIAGAGIIAIPELLVERDVVAGRLVRLLGGWIKEPSTLHIVFPSRRDMTPRVRAFADHMAEWLRGSLPG